MKAWRIVAAAAGVMAVVTFGYALIYVSRWEWRRATLVAVLAVLCAVVAFGVAVDARLRELSRRLAASDSGVRTTPWRAARDGQSGPTTFDWLQPPSDSFGVFIPVLLGTGLAVSALAWAVERLAFLSGTDLRDRRPALPDTLLLPPDAALDDVAESSARVAHAWLRRPNPR